MIKSSFRDFFKGCCSHLFKLPDFFCLKCGRCSVDGVLYAFYLIIISIKLGYCIKAYSI